jgi:acetyl-CoA acetyltransferase
MDSDFWRKVVSKVYVAGVAMVPFTKPGRGAMYDAMGAEAVRGALADADLGYADVQQAYVGFCYGDSTSGQKAIYQVGLTGIPIINVNNACATGSTALFLARQAVESGMVDVALALGFEQMTPGALDVMYTDRPSILDSYVQIAANSPGDEPDKPAAARLFGGAGAEYQRRTGFETKSFAMVAEKARRHAANNPMAIFRDPLSVDEIMASPQIFGPLTRLQCCPPTCGAAAAIIVSEKFKRANPGRYVEIAAQAMTTDPEPSFNSGSLIDAVGFNMARAAAQQVYEKAGIGPKDIPDSGEAEKFIRDGDNSYGGRTVTNPSGGLLSKGHPLGATGLAQCSELVWQIRGDAGARQVDGARVALQHNLGLGGACVVTMYKAV